jgi:TIR domain
MSVAEGGGIFVSYRRQETSHLAGRLADRLADRFGEGQVFIDVDTIEPGVDFAEEIARAVATCKVLLAIIGPTWLTATDERGRRRLDDPGDIVRLEIEAALARGVRVIPILAEGAPMPSREDLPGSLAGLARRNALFIRHESFRSDAGRLVTAIERVLAGASGTEGDQPPAEQPTRIEREIAVCKRFDVPPEKGLNREEASRAFSENGINPRACGSWIQHGWIIREGDRRWLSDKGRDWIRDQTTATS